MDTAQKLALLADGSRYDLSCACGTRGGTDHRRRGRDGLWLYPTSLPRGGTSLMLKTLMSNACVNNCLYCPFRRDEDFRRCTLSPDEVVRAFMAYVRQKEVIGLFLTSAVVRDPDHTMDRIAAVARLLRARYGYPGYIHLKIIPGASDAAVEEALSLADTVSLNVEAPTRAAFRRLTDSKDYDRDIVRTVRLISRLTAAGGPHAGTRQMTQFVVGAAGESDADIVQATFGLYKRLGLARVYFSAYQQGLGAAELPAEGNPPLRPGDRLTREHRMYQVDWLIRRYGFGADEIPFGPDGNLSLDADPKEVWARRHPEWFPLDVNSADRFELLRVPGFGEVTVRRILMIRRHGGRIRSLRQLGTPGKRLRKAKAYIKFGHTRRCRARRAGTSGPPAVNQPAQLPLFGGAAQAAGSHHSTQGPGPRAFAVTNRALRPPSGARLSRRA